MFKVYEVFKDGKKYPMYEHEDKFECECWLVNHLGCTNALRNGFAELIIEEKEEE